MARSRSRQKAPPAARASCSASVAKTAFVDGMHTGVLVAAGAAFLGAIVAALWLPARARDDDRREQADEFAEEHARATRASPRRTLAETPAEI